LPKRKKNPVGLVLNKLPQGGALAGPWHLILDEEFTEPTFNTNLWQLNWDGEGGVQNGVPTYAANAAIVPTKGLVLTLASATSGASINTNPTWSAGPGFQFVNGYFEFQATFPNNNGAWCAGWMTGQSPWPNTGEFDVAETFSGDGKLTVGNYHYYNGGDQSANDPNPITGALGVSHVFGVDWEPGVANFYIDGVLHNQLVPPLLAANIVTAPQYLVFNYGLNGTAVPGSQMIVRYARVWQH
jgi:hypothetical protein